MHARAHMHTRYDGQTYFDEHQARPIENAPRARTALIRGLKGPDVRLSFAATAIAIIGNLII